MKDLPLQPIGAVLCLAGLLSAGYFATAFQTSVEVPKQEIGGQTFGGNSVENIGLMNDQQNGIVISCAVAIIGALLVVAGRVGDRSVSAAQAVGNGIECPRCHLINPATAERCDCGYVFPRHPQRS